MVDIRSILFFTDTVFFPFPFIVRGLCSLRCNMFRDYFINWALKFWGLMTNTCHSHIIPLFQNSIRIREKMRTYYYPAPDATESQEGKGLTTLLTFDLLTFWFSGLRATVSGRVQRGSGCSCVQRWGKGEKWFGLHLVSSPSPAPAKEIWHRLGKKISLN